MNFECKLKIQAVFFDIGNTLISLDTDFVRKTAEKVICKKIPKKKILEAEAKGKEHVDDIVLSKISGSDKTRAFTYFQIMMEYVGSGPQHAQKVKEMLIKKDKKDGLWRVIDKDAREVLLKLKEKGLVLGVISNSDGRVNRLLKKFNLLDYFNVVIDSSLVGVEKPDKKIFHLALSKANIPARRAVHVGDLYAVDVLGAKAAGMHAVLIDRTGFYRHPPCATIKTLSELLKLDFA